MGRLPLAEWLLKNMLKEGKALAAKIRPPSLN